MRWMMAAAVMLGLGLASLPGNAAGTQCRDASGKFVKCEKPTHCRDDSGKFVKCSAKGAKPA